MLPNVLFTQLIYDIRECKVSNLRKPLASLCWILNDKLHDINMINYYFFNKNSCVYECFTNFTVIDFEIWTSNI